MGTAPSASSGRSSGSQTGFDITPQQFTDLRGPLRDLFLGTVFPGFEGALTFDSPALTPGGLDRFRAPLSGQELTNIDRLQGQAEGLSPNEQASQDLLGRRLRGDFFDPQQNDPLRNVIRFQTEEINRSFDEQALEQRSLFARAGQALPESSPFAQASADLSGARLGAIGQAASNVLFGAQQSERDRQVQAIEQVRANSRGVFERSQASLQASALPRLVNQLGIEGGLQEFNARLAAFSNALGLGTQVAQPTVANRGQQQAKNVGAGL